MPRLLSLLPVLGVAVLAVPATLPTVPVRTEPSASPGTCLPNGIDASKRKNLVNADGESYPVARVVQFDDFSEDSRKRKRCRFLGIESSNKRKLT